MEEYRITLVVPCLGRPMRTRRMIKNILEQNISKWEAFVIGDGCPEFQKMIDSGECNNFIREAETKGNKLHCHNLDRNYGRYGSPIYDYCIKLSNGKYVIFAGNDDMLESDHFEHYLSEIENSDYDMVYYKTFLDPLGSIRDPEICLGGIGHSEMIIKRSAIGDLTHDPIYESDWSLLSKLIDNGIKMKKSESNKTTYNVMHIPGLPLIDTID